LGEWDQSLRYLREGYDLAKSTRDYQTIAEAAIWLGELFLEMEEYSEAEKYLNEGDSVYEKAENKAWQVYIAHPPLAKLYLKKGETEKAKELIDSMCEYAAKERFKEAVPTTEMLKGVLFREQKNWEQSAQHFEKSLQECKSLNYQKWHVWEFAELLYEYGLMYLDRNQQGDNEQACLLLNQAQEIYQSIDATRKLERTRSRIVHGETAQAASNLEPTADVLKSVPARITTGYADLDTLLCGGIPENFAVALTAPSCDERALLIKRFLEAGARKDEVIFYLTADLGDSKILADEFQSDFYLFICNPQADAIIKSAPNIFKLKGVENLTDISIALTSAIRKLGPSLKGSRRICVGLVSDVLLQHHAVQTRRWLTALLPELKSAGFTTLAVIDPQMHPSEEIHAIIGLFEGEINLYEKETEKGSEKFLKIKKMANQRYLKDELLLKEEDMQK
jgi:KaiC/GvpD/RAD55 family RecA-like ATPase